LGIRWVYRYAGFADARLVGGTFMDKHGLSEANSWQK